LEPVPLLLFCLDGLVLLSDGGVGEDGVLAALDPLSLLLPVPVLLLLLLMLPLPMPLEPGVVSFERSLALLLAVVVDELRSLELALGAMPGLSLRLQPYRPVAATARAAVVMTR